MTPETVLTGACILLLGGFCLGYLAAIAPEVMKK